MILRDFLINGNKSYYETTAEKILRNITFSHPRNIDIYELCDLYGIMVHQTEAIKSAAVMMANKGRRGIITLNKSLKSAKERVLLAEEFSHLYLHQSDQLTATVNEINKMEIQALKLASNLLIPTDWLLDIEVNPSLNQKYIMAADVAEQFNVPPDFAYIRLKELKDNYIFGTEQVLTNTIGYIRETSFFETNDIFVVLNKENVFPLT